MRAKIFLVMILLCFACQSGKIPCPKFKKVKLEKKAKNRSAYAYTARAETEARQLQSRNPRSSDVKEIQRVNIEEWDCPRPGTRKYMPKAVKENIRKNMQRMSADSTATAGNK